MRKWKENIFTIPNILSELGKVLDPIADKLTQGVLLICFLYQYKMAKYVLILFLIKESYMGVMGLKTISATRKNEGAMWYGKVNTASDGFAIFIPRHSSICGRNYDCTVWDVHVDGIDFI